MEGALGSNYKESFDLVVRAVVRMKVLAVDSMLISQDFIRTPSENATSRIADVQTKLNDVVSNLDDLIVSTVALYNPVGRDLRFVLSALKISYDIQGLLFWIRRSVGCAFRANDCLSGEAKELLLEMIGISIFTMNKIFRMMLKADHYSTSIYLIKGTIEKVIAYDDRVDQIYSEIRQEFSPQSPKKDRKPSELVGFYEIVNSAKGFEKAGDLISDIALIANYVLTGSRCLPDFDL